MTFMEKPIVWDAELRSKDGTVALRAKWSWTQNCTTEIQIYSGNVLKCEIGEVYSGIAKHRNDLDVNGAYFDSITDFSNTGDDIISKHHLANGQSTSPALSFLRELAIGSSKQLYLRFLLPPHDGYITRSDLMESSTNECPVFAIVKGFVQPAEHVAAARLSESEVGTAKGLSELLQSSVAVAVGPDNVVPEDLDVELKARLSWPWVVPDPVKHTRVAIFEEPREAVMCQEFYATARACAVSMIIVDGPTHWAAAFDGPYAHYREDFVPFVRGAGDSVDQLPLRIVETIRGLPYKIDGIMGLYDMIMPAVARAAEILGLPTLGSTAYLRSTDKSQTRRFCPKSSAAMRVESLEDFDDQVSTMEQPLEFPVIVKPARSHSAQGVTRVDTSSNLRPALQVSFDAQKRIHSHAGVSFETPPPVIIETYCDGPEVDVNLLLWCGEILHSEVVDNFPPLAEQDSGNNAYQAVGSLSPSALPYEEIIMLKQDIADVVRKFGLHSGVVHAEARVQNSAYHFPSGQLAVRPGPEPQSRSSSTFLIEINPRFAGWPEAILSRFVYGIDYFAAHLMHTIGDEARFRAFAKGFGRAPKYHYFWVPQVIDQEEGGIMPKIPSVENSSIADSFVGHRYYWRAGEKVPGKEGRPWPGAGFMFLRSANGAEDVSRATLLALKQMKIHLTP